MLKIHPSDGFNGAKRSAGTLYAIVSTTAAQNLLFISDLLAHARTV